MFRDISNVTGVRQNRPSVKSPVASTNQITHVLLPLLERMTSANSSDKQLVELVNHCKKLSQDQEENRLTLPEHLIELLKEDKINSESLSLLEFHFTQWEYVLEKVSQKECEFTLESEYTLQEMSFWESHCKAMQTIKSQINSFPVENVVSLLKDFNHDLSRWNDLIVRLDEYSAEGMKTQVAFKKFPMDFLYTTTLEALLPLADSIHECLSSSFSNNSSQWKAYFLDLLTLDFSNKVFQILRNSRVLGLSFSEFDLQTESARKLFTKWETNLLSYAESSNINYQTNNRKFVNQIIRVRTIIREFERLKVAVMRVIPPIQGFNALSLLEAAYTKLSFANPFDLSKQEEQHWFEALKFFEDKLDNIETEIANYIASQFDSDLSSQELVRLFANFSPIFFRPKIRGSIKEYQAKVINFLKDEVLCLENDVLPDSSISAQIKFLQKKNNQLSQLKHKIVDVFGPQWNQFTEAQELHVRVEKMSIKFDPSKAFDSWEKNLASQDLEIKGNLFKYVDSVLVVDFNFDIDSIYQEIARLEEIGFSPSFRITMLSNKGHHLYPMALVLSEAIKKCNSLQISISPENMLLVDTLVEIKEQIKVGLDLKWDLSSRLADYISMFSKLVNSLKEEVETMLPNRARVKELVDSIPSANYSHEAFSAILGEIQAIIMSFSETNCLSNWVQDLNSQLRDNLLLRLTSALELWNSVMSKKPDSVSATCLTGCKDSTSLTIEMYNHEIIYSSDSFQLDPLVSTSIAFVKKQLEDWINVIAKLPQIALSSVTAPATFEYLTGLLPENLLASTYSFLNYEKESDEFVATWVPHLRLWNARIRNAASLGDDLSDWRAFIHELNDSKIFLSTSKVRVYFSCICINFSNVKSQLKELADLHYDKILSSFVSRIAGASSLLQSLIVDTQTNSIQPLSEDFSIAADQILAQKKLEPEVLSWKTQIDAIEECELELRGQFFHFPANWISFKSLISLYEKLQEAMTKQQFENQQKVPFIQQKIKDQLKQCEDKILQLQRDWKTSKPVSDEVDYDTALGVLTIFNGRSKRLRAEWKVIEHAKNVLEFTDDFGSSFSDILEEIEGLHQMWRQLSDTWHTICDLKELPWASVEPKQLKCTLEGLLDGFESFSANVQKFAPFSSCRTKLLSLIEINSSITELRSAPLKERHWAELKNKLHTKWDTKKITLGCLWDSDIVTNSNAYSKIIQTAQGEIAVESFLLDCQTYWESLKFEFADFHKKCNIIAEWKSLFARVVDDINYLTHMKRSPYFKVFEKEATAWEDKLTLLSSVLTTWSEVQRKWAYLHSIFSENADVKLLLPKETVQFDEINTTFLSLMRKAFQLQLVIDSLVIEDIEATLTRLSSMLDIVQRGLGEYLEKQRINFPRFYFVGDEDLLELVASPGLAKFQSHIKKLFSGISSLTVAKDGKTITGFCSVEGELIEILQPIDSSRMPKADMLLSYLEKQMKSTLSHQTVRAYNEIHKMFSKEMNYQDFRQWLDRYSAQILLVASRINSTTCIEKYLTSSTQSLSEQLRVVEEILSFLADAVLGDMCPLTRKKHENAITEFIHQRDVVRELINDSVSDCTNFEWLSQMRYYLNEVIDSENGMACQVRICMANTTFSYGFEYLGALDMLVQTPLTRRCYLTLTQALNSSMGGSPQGPAGTGKTETIKALGVHFGKPVFVFCCDQVFDLQAISRIFIGLCRVGAWGCFDEFNRLEEGVLSAVSQQIQSIQHGLYAHSTTITLLNKPIQLNPQVAIYITMNPGYAGRSNLPDNLKQLFRSIIMLSPDSSFIAQAMLFSQGFKTAEQLATKTVTLFKLCDQYLSRQKHYDFGLRALKTVLVNSGILKRKVQEKNALTDEEIEQRVLLQSICETVMPKLVLLDTEIFRGLLTDVFPQARLWSRGTTDLKSTIIDICVERKLTPTDEFIAKTLQIFDIQQLRHGVILHGKTGCGKTASREILIEAMARLDNVEAKTYVINPKAITRNALFGFLDTNTRSWSDGVFVALLRKIIQSRQGESDQIHWIVFDGDIDPEWIENLNALLDDNKLVTLPNGERLELPSNVRIFFEVDSLEHATPATVSRCGMVYFTDSLPNQVIFNQELAQISDIPVDPSEVSQIADVFLPPGLALQSKFRNVIATLFEPDCLVDQALVYCSKLEHIMGFSRFQAITVMFTIFKSSMKEFILNGYQLTENEPVFRILAYAMLWGFGGSMDFKNRLDFALYLQKAFNLPVYDEGANFIDYKVVNGALHQWQSFVPVANLEAKDVDNPHAIIPTIDAIRNSEILQTLLSNKSSLVLLVGPPGSGKNLTLTNLISSLPSIVMQEVNFSGETQPALILAILQRHCEYVESVKGVTLQPRDSKSLVIFCDELNLPSPDMYGTQHVITFIWQLVEYQGFWHPVSNKWISVKRVQFVGACNPPTDAGRFILPERFLRHISILYVDYPSRVGLTQIYQTFNTAIFKSNTALSPFIETITNIMIDYYFMCKERFTSAVQAHYIYSPRELTRWIRSIHRALQRRISEFTIDSLTRLLLHEGLRLFQDRLVTPEEQIWAGRALDSTILKHIPQLDKNALARPVLFSERTTGFFSSVAKQDILTYFQNQIPLFQEQEGNIPLVIFDEALDHILRIDSVFKQNQGHMALIGGSGSGKVLLTRFAAFCNKLSVFRLKVNNRYTAAKFDEDLQGLLKRAGCDGERICFIFDESNVMESGFLEKMNTLLASGDIPGIFTGDSYTALLQTVKQQAHYKNINLKTEEETYSWFTQRIRENLHVVFTMNPASSEYHNRSSTSPALFNRCVLNWFGDWSPSALFSVGMELFALNLEDEAKYTAPFKAPSEINSFVSYPMTYREAIVSSLVLIQKSLNLINLEIKNTQGRFNYVTPRHFLDMIAHLSKLINKKRLFFTEQQSHLEVGLQKLEETQLEVKELQLILEDKNEKLTAIKNQLDVKLEKLMKDKFATEQQRVSVSEMKEHLEKQTLEIQTDREFAEAELAVAQPALEDAKKAVTGISAKDLEEIKNYTRPAQLIQDTLEAVCILLGSEKAKLTWAEIRKIFTAKDFKQSVINFKNSDITEKVEKWINENYLSKPNVNFEKVNHSSKACGPLFKWIHAHVNYSNIKNKIKPLQEKIERLEADSLITSEKLIESTSTLEILEADLVTLTAEYSLLVNQSDTIKEEMDLVKVKVDRSSALLDNLFSERKRWQQSANSFEQEIKCLVGNAIIGAAFIVYGGFYDQHYRNSLINSCQTYLSAMNIEYNKNLSIINFFSSDDERNEWSLNGLPADDLAIENAIILNNFNRYPLIIDPSGQAIDFLINNSKNQQIRRTTISDSNFVKDLEMALRFGTPILIEDVDVIDPILNTILNHELKKVGGNIFIRLGEHDVPFSPSFMLYLATRDPSARFTPDLCSRVTLVNFTVTMNSLQVYCLDQLLKFEQPTSFTQRRELQKLQGECQVKLLQLEKQLLDVLFQSSGKILEDNVVLSALEQLKREAFAEEQKVKEIQEIMAAVVSVGVRYQPVALACCRIFFALQKLKSLHFLYQFSLNSFLNIFCSVLKNTDLQECNEQEIRIDTILRNLFKTTFHRATKSLLHQDWLPFGLALAQIYLSLTESQNEEWELLFGRSILRQDEGAPTPLSKLLRDDQHSLLSKLLEDLPYLREHAVASMQVESDEWCAFINQGAHMPQSFSSKLKELGYSDHRVLLVGLTFVKDLHPERFTQRATEFLCGLFGEHFMPSEEDLATTLEHEVDKKYPIMLCSKSGYDPAFRVDELATQLGIKHYVSIAMGSKEGFENADSAIELASRVGGWVLLKNVHLTINWLKLLDKKLHSSRLTAHAEFHLFMTTDINPKLPSTLVSSSNVLICEPPSGIKANLLRTLMMIPQSRMNRQPQQRSRLYFLLAWFHAIIQERVQCVPYGWTKSYDFTDTQKMIALDTIDYWLDNMSKDSGLQFPAIRTILGQTIYGGYVDNIYDQRLLDTLLARLFSPQSMSPNFAIVEKENIMFPDCTSHQEFLNWTNQLSDQAPPTWLGLPLNAHTLLLSNETAQIKLKLKKLNYNTLVEATSSESNGSASDHVITWCKEWLELLPVPKNIVKKNYSNPICQYFSSQYDIACGALNHMRFDMEAIQAHANKNVTLLAEIEKDIIPAHWKSHLSISYSSLDHYLQYFVKCFAQIQDIIDAQVNDPESTSSILTNPISLNLLFNPQNFITSVQQLVARQRGCSVEDLKVYLCPTEQSWNSNCFILGNITLQGAVCDEAYKLSLSDSMQSDLASMMFEWRMTKSEAVAPINPLSLPVPLYGDDTRKLFLFSFEMSSDIPSQYFVESSIAIIAK